MMPPPLLRVLASVVVTACLAAPAQHAPTVPHGRLETIHGYQVLSLDGTPEQMGAAGGVLLKATIQRVVRAMITDGIGADRAAYENILDGSRVMAEYQPEPYRRELRAMARAADVGYDDLLLLQYFGDVRRCIEGPGASSLCTAFAVLPPLTAGKTCIVGRNLDYFDHGVGDYASLLVYYRPEGRTPFVTVTWAGIINGWTLLNEKGIVVSNNTCFGAKDHSLRGISTCFLLRYVAERAGTVDEGVDLIRKAQRSCGTAMLVASGNPPDAAIVEFDASQLAVRRPEDGFVGVANGFQKLYRSTPGSYYGRIGQALEIARQHAGKIDFGLEIAGVEGVPIDGMNLHCVTIDAAARKLRVAMGRIPAYRLEAKTFRLTPEGLVAD